MATRNFLNTQDIEEARKRLLARVDEFPSTAAIVRRDFSLWLQSRLLTRLNEFGPFLELGPVVLGSWARDELCPKSDVDLLFLGETERVAKFIEAAFKGGMKLRARTPEDYDDWTVGVEPFDVMAIETARALNPRDHDRVMKQKTRAAAFKTSIFQAVKKERLERRARQDSVSNYLEPNLKFGAGGLRDIEQALSIARLYPKPFETQDHHAFEVLSEVKEELLFLRCWLHILNSNDILTAQDQLEISQSAQFKSPGELMKHVQSQLERASFYADWAVAFSRSTERVRANAKTGSKSLGRGVRRLRQSPDLLMQYELRRRSPEMGKPLSQRARGKLLVQALQGECRDDYLVALYRTRLVEVLIPDFAKLRGLVQHDHYHRFTADAHLIQTVREVERARLASKRLYGKVGVLAKELQAADWWILKLTALFHDLGKGRKTDHSEVGAKLVEEYFANWKWSELIKKDVQWLVENHLLLSSAAFRQNPQEPATWRRLFEQGVLGKRLTLLALFTAIDIRATNPDAWTDWKSELLLGLVMNMRSPEAKTLQGHLEFAEKSNAQKVEDLLLQLDPLLLAAISPRRLVVDLEKVLKARSDLTPAVFKSSEGHIWIRFHRRKDEPGILLNYVRTLFGLGLSIQVSFIHTIEGVGVYDWFLVVTKRSVKQVQKWLAHAVKQVSPPQVAKVKFKSLSLIAADGREWIFSLRGRDQHGLLVTAVSAFNDLGLSLRWARAHTWGQQVEDTFSVQPFGEVDTVLSELKSRLVT